MEERGDEEATKRKNKNRPKRGDGRNNWRRKQVEDKTV